MKWYKVLIYVLFHTSSKKKSPSIAILTWFLILGKSKLEAKMATIVGDVTGLQQLHHPQNIPHIVEKIKTLETLQHIKNSGEGFHHPPPLPLYLGGGMNMSVCPRVKLRLS